MILTNNYCYIYNGKVEIVEWFYTETVCKSEAYAVWKDNEFNGRLKIKVIKIESDLSESTLLKITSA